ncbi:MAG: TetR/AcrR family transcriptional regulator [Desulfobacterales bacterium]|nr:TetR/AcrR family transcriptional regulator [Desulfobacterales bacterium]
MSKRNAILETATLLFARSGFDQTSMSALSKATGVAGSTIFHHFKNKEDLFINILSNTQNTIISAFDAHQQDSAHKNGLEMVEGAVEFYLTFTLEKQDLFLMLHRHFPYQMAETNKQCHESLEAIYECLVGLFEQGVSLGIKDGSIQVASAHNTAMLLFAMVDGVARLNTYRLYQTGALYSDLIASCRRLLQVDLEASNQ